MKEILNQHHITTADIRISERQPTGNIHQFAITEKPAKLLFINTINSWHPTKRPRLETIRAIIKASANPIA